MFENCSCVAEHLYQLSNDELSGSLTSSPSSYLANSTAADGMCDINCHNLAPFLLCAGVLIFLLFVLKIPNVLVTIRWVHVHFPKVY